MPRPLDLVGKPFGLLRVERLLPEKRWGFRVWGCRCACGQAVKVATRDLTSGNTRSCGRKHRRELLAGIVRARKDCRRCGSPFDPKSPGHVYCGPRCKSLARRPPRPPIPCTICGAPVSSRRRNTAIAAYCSEDCARRGSQIRKLRGRGATVSIQAARLAAALPGREGR